MNQNARSKLILFALAAVLILSHSGIAIGQNGYFLYYAAPELVSARATALGPGFTAIANDPACAMINPAGLGFIRGFQLVPMYSGQGTEGGGVATFSGVKYIHGIGTVGLTFQSGTQAAFNTGMLGLEDNFIKSDKQAIISFARSLNPHFSAGLSYKYLFGSDPPDDNYSFGEYGMGLFFRTWQNSLRIGASVDNLTQEKAVLNGGTVNLGGGNSFDIGYMFEGVRVYRAAAALSTRNPKEPTTIFLGTAIPQAEDVGLDKTQGFLNVGIEQWFLYNQPKSWALRASYTGRKDISAFGAGMSLRLSHEYDHWRFDYSYQVINIKDDLYRLYNGDQELGGGRHTISIIYEFDGARHEIDYAGNVRHPTEQELSQEFASLMVEPKNRSSYDEGEGDYYITVPPSHKEWQQMRLMGRVEDLSISWRKQMIFLLQSTDGVEFMKWKLYIHDKPPTSPVNFSTMENRAVRVLDGTGNIPEVIVWDVKDYQDQICKGYYYYFMVAWDYEGNAWKSRWVRFHIK
ncbi:MAG: hypothetical protein GF307_12325 [candidate division Zixibacteria bacterium]|nr:hypothetical protein [candidate division Zixibacteria bacterium]